MFQEVLQPAAMLLKSPRLWTTAALVVSAVNASEAYFQPNSTGIKIQNGFERVYIQVRCRFSTS
jgi:alpha-D-xyloside xylohydrolase